MPDEKETPDELTDSTPSKPTITIAEIQPNATATDSTPTITIAEKDGGA